MFCKETWLITVDSIWYSVPISMDNTVGSLTQFQKSLVIGCVLGDGYLRTMSGRTDAFLEINHSYKARMYVDWKYRALRAVCVSGPVARKGNQGRIAYRFFTKQDHDFSNLYQRFYKDGRKIIPRDLLLDPVTLSVWFMDDGSRCGMSDYYLNTQQFERSDQELLIEKLQILGLRSSLNKDKTYYRIRFFLDSVPRLRDLIKKHCIPEMMYKLG